MKKKLSKCLVLFLALFLMIGDIGNLSFIRAIGNDDVVELTISYHLGDENGNMIAEPYIADMERGESYNVKSPEIENFTLKNSEQAVIEGTVGENEPNHEINIKVIYDYDKNSEKEYTIKYVAVNENQKERVLETIKGTAPVDTIVPVPAKEYDGFQRESGQPTSVKVTADGRASVTVKYRQIGQVYILFETEGTYIAPITARPGKDITDKINSVKNPTRPGYVFDGWDKELPKTMPNEDLIIKAKWKAAETTYHVLFWGENLDKSNGDYSLLSKRVEPRKAVTGTIIEPEDKDKSLGKNGKTGMNNEFYGLVYDEKKTSPITVKSDGTSVLNVYYKRDTWKINFREKPFDIEKDSYEDNSVKYSISGAYGTLVQENQFPSETQLREWYGNNWYRMAERGGSKGGYVKHWAGLNPYCFLPLVSERKEAGNVIELYPEYNESEDKLKEITVNYFLEKSEGNYDKVRDFTVSIKETTGELTFKPYQDGYLPWEYKSGNTLEEADSDVPTKIKDGSVSFSEKHAFYNIYQNRVESKLEYKSADGSKTYKMLNEVPYGTPVDLGVIPNDIPEGYRFIGWYTSPDTFNSEEPLKEFKMPSKNTVIYAKIAPVERTVSFDSNGGTEIEPQVVSNGDKALKPADPVKKGYKFVGWYTEAENGTRWSFDRQVTADVTLYARWSRIQTTKYRIEHFVRDESEPFYTETLKGYIGDTVYALPLSPLDKNYPKDLTYIKAAETSKALELNENTENVIRFEYDIVAKKNYKVSYVDIRNNKELYSENKTTLNTRIIEKAINPDTVTELNNYIIKEDMVKQVLHKDSENVIVFKCLPSDLKVTYSFKSVDGKNLPEDVNKLVPQDNNRYTFGETVNLISPKQESVRVDGGNWIFVGYRIVEKSNVTFDIEDNTEVVGSWQYVKEDTPPTLEVPEVLEFNVGDKFDPRDPDIIKGLLVSDKEDTDLGLDDLKIEEEIPRKGKFLWLFATDDTNTLTTPGTYEVKYSITDSANHTVSKSLKVKVHGIPYFTQSDGKTEYKDKASTVYLRSNTTDVDYYENLRAFYLKASDTIGVEASVTEINNSLNGGNQIDGELAGYHFANVKNPEIMVDNINDAGKYIMKYRANTPTNATAEIDRDVYVRSNVKNVNAHSIIIPKDEGKHENWESFLETYNSEINMRAEVDVPDEDGNVSTITIHNSQILTDIKDIPFGELKDGERYVVKFNITDTASNYEDSTATSTFMIDVKEVVGLAPHIQLPEDYDNERVVEDKVMVNNKERTGNFLQALLDETKIFDVDNTDIEQSRRYENTPEKEGTASHNPGERYGISEKGIESIYRVDNGKNEVLYTKDMSLSIQEVDTIIRKMYDIVGEYKVTYYAIDGDNNRIDRERIIRVASKTKFVEKGSNPGVNDIEITSVHLRQSGSTETATGVIAYHIDSDGSIHAQAALSKNDIEMSRIGKQDIEFTTTHHHQYLPGTNKTPRKQDSKIKSYYIHGNISIQGVKDSVHFMDEEVNLLDGKTISASFAKAVDNGTVPTEADLTTDHGTSLKVNEPQKAEVIYTAKDNVTGVAAGGTVTKKRTLTMIGLPEIINAPKSVKVSKNASENEIMEAIKVNGVIAKINLVDSEQDLTKSIYYDFSNIKNNEVILKVSYQLSPDNIREIETKVMVEYKKPPVITGKERLELNTGDLFDKLATPEIKLDKGDFNVTLDDIKIEGEVPTDAMGKLTTPGTYVLQYSITDGYGNVSELTTKVLVDGLAEIVGENLKTRVSYGIDVNENISASYLEAQETPGDAELKTTDVTMVNIKDVNGNVIGEEQFYKTTGLYTIEYIAKNSNNRETKFVRNAYVHGNIEFTSLKDKVVYTGTEVNLLDDVEALFDKVESNGNIVKVNADISVNAKQKDNTITSDEPTAVEVTYVATDNITGVEDGKTTNKTRKITFAGNPYIESIDLMNIKDSETEAEVLEAIKEKTAAYIYIGEEKVDLTQDVKYKFEKNQVIATVSYTIDKETRTADHTIKLNYGPKIDAEDQILYVGDAFDEKIALSWATAKDEEEGDISSSIVITENTVDIEHAGVYQITYSVTDKGGLTSTKTITVNVVEKQETNTPPVINANDKTLNVGDAFDEKIALSWATAKDEEEGDISSSIVITENTVDIEHAGVYQIIYSVTDKDGLTSTKTITVTVKALPVIQPDDNSTPSEDSSSESLPSEEKDTEVPSTGIHNNLYGWGVLLLASGMTLFMSMLKRKKSKQINK